ncbi:ABC transporter ATP-binding protein [Candidatus Aerophobetes bacterium]|uniref:ABC transporter ATP-binding protein n=1 Tax=Aerophobetes bacterium TaxID=2030807 RepID=A0A2A4X5Z0_UNCAE|nr:MAG: ABC transporter ATP-binding protein [Candidatus Aerophobetes bacterium]
MSALLSLNNITKSIGPKQLFSGFSFSIHSGEKVGIIGPNGAGKSTLMKIMEGQESFDSGDIIRKKGITIGYSAQMPIIPEMPLIDYLKSVHSGMNNDEAELKAKQLLSLVGFTDYQACTTSLSGGWKKRLDIARALLTDPELLLLDEPTNHLDVESIEWLESFLIRLNSAVAIISHDRSFLEKVSNSTLEINPVYPGGLFQVKGSFHSFFEKKEDFLKAQEKKLASLKGKVKQETAWLNTTPQARTTKSKSRIENAYLLQEELSHLKQRNKKTRINLDFTSSHRQTRKLLTANNLSKSFGDKPLFSSLNILLTPQTRLGIVGANGCGKTTLLKMLSGQESATMGTIKTADGLNIVYFDQQREQLPLHLTLQEALSPSSDMVNYRGQSIHVAGWAKRFGFPSDNLQLPIKCLSGGQLARILIARLMLKEADLLFLDEPTNDLDIETLEVIEESLTSFKGALVIISHDRSLMKNLCNNLLHLNTDGTHTLYPTYELYEKSKKQSGKKKQVLRTDSSVKKKQVSLSYKESKELESIEATIEQIELSIETLTDQLSDSNDLSEYEKVGELSEQLNTLYERWQYLLDKKEGKL